MKVSFNKIKGIEISKKGGFITLFVIYILGVAFTFFILSTTAYGPVHQGDERRYWNMAYDLYQGTFTLLKSHHHPLLYPLSILPAFILFYPSGTYVAAKFLNAIYFTSVLFPCYLILRKYVNRNISLIASAVILFNPAQVVFPRQILSENLFYPLLMWAFYFATTYIFPPRHKLRYLENFIFGLILGLLLLTRYIFFAIIPAMLVIWWLKPYLDEKIPLLFSLKKLNHFLVVVSPILLILGIWIYMGYREGLDVKELFGFTIASGSNPLQLSLSRLFMWVVLYSSYMALIAAPILGILMIIPFYVRWNNWQEDLPRFFIAIALIAMSFLAACVRHSWRAAYNYPDPGQMMGRYIFYVGPLFIITAVVAIKSMKLPNLHSNDWGYWLFSFLSGGIIVLAYAIIYRGLFFLGRPSIISGSSTDDYLFSSIASLFVPASVLSNMIIAWFMGRNNRALFTSLFALLSLLYLYGDVKLYQKRVLPQQFFSVQAYYLIKTIQAGGLESQNPESTLIKVRIEPGSKDDIDDNVYGGWFHTLQVYGYRNVAFDEDARLAGQREAYNFIQVGETEYRIDGVDKEDFLACQCEKYELLGKYYTIQPVLNK